MGTELTAFERLNGIDGVYVAQGGKLRCTAIRLGSGALCLYSPARGLGDVGRKSLQALGEVTHLLAPNHYHHTGLKEYSEAFPSAKLCCTAAAKLRLEKQTGLPIFPLEDAELVLPPNAKFIEPSGLKTGEVWIEMLLQDHLLWIVTDAFRGPKTKAGAVAKFPELLGAFPTYGIADRRVYSDWFSRYVASAPPTMIIPCHGSMIMGPDLGKDAMTLVDALLS
jgi:hypothetical protein